MTLNIADKIQVGNVVVVPSQGPCTLISITQETQYGCTDTYYTFRASGENAGRGTIILPKNQLQKCGARLPTSPEKMLQALHKLKTGRCVFRGNPYKREQHFRDQLCSPNPSELAACIRDLWTAEGAERSYIFLQLYEKALVRLAHEVAIVFQVPYQEVRGKIESIIVNRTAPEDLFGNAKSRD